MKKLLMLILVMLFSVYLFGCVSSKLVYQVKDESQMKEATQLKVVNQEVEDKLQIDETDKKAVAGIVEDFGKKLGEGKRRICSKTSYYSRFEKDRKSLAY